MKRPTIEETRIVSVPAEPGRIIRMYHVALVIYTDKSTVRRCGNVATTGHAEEAALILFNAEPTVPESAYDMLNAELLGEAELSDIPDLRPKTPTSKEGRPC